MLCHGRIGCSLSLQDAMGMCCAFLAAHPREVLVARVKDEAAGQQSARGIDDLMRELAESAEYPLFLEMRLPSLREVRGRIVLLCDWAAGQLGLCWAGESMVVQDQYWQKTGTAKWQVAKRHLNSAAPSPDRLHVHFTSATALPSKVPLAIARSVNPKLAQYLRCASRCRFLGVIAMDFPSAALCELIVRHNPRQPHPCRRVSYLAAGSPKVGEWLDNLQCELLAAASRADAAVLSRPDELRQSRLPWLARVYVRLVVDRSSAELLQPALGEFAPQTPNFPKEALPPSAVPGELAVPPPVDPARHSAVPRLLRRLACLPFRGGRAGVAARPPSADEGISPLVEAPVELKGDLMDGDVGDLASFRVDADGELWTDFESSPTGADSEAAESDVEGRRMPALWERQTAARSERAPLSDRDWPASVSEPDVVGGAERGAVHGT